MRGNITDVRVLYTRMRISSPDRPKLGRSAELMTGTHVRGTEVRGRIRQTVGCSLIPLGLFCLNGSLYNQLKGVLLNMHIYVWQAHLETAN